jgi:hypothetical protein
MIKIKDERLIGDTFLRCSERLGVEFRYKTQAENCDWLLIEEKRSASLY